MKFLALSVFILLTAVFAYPSDPSTMELTDDDANVMKCCRPNKFSKCKDGSRGTPWCGKGCKYIQLHGL
ncbi:hypothetical protein BDV25DRAFT_137321 [Aspergillus avenaceus]|uniref:Uncharacterized protein n=1 Tax=Aspergillus avenaceus TaxID=36643 RepID=A0A5N6U3A7_ASPAV|nr:hypothetical protein BDV25DRAFT_137321 [Aspergillus avenaceus]